MISKSKTSKLFHSHSTRSADQLVDNDNQKEMAISHSFLSSQYINGIYIPSGLLLVGIAIVKKEWLPYAVVVAIILGSWKIYSNRQSDFFQ